MDDMWLKLFRRALDLIGSCSELKTPEPKWTFGGGTVLFMEFGHRYSKDIDIFLTDAQYISYFSPRLNPVSESWMENNGGKYIESSHFLKIEIKDKESEGEIDFIVGPHLMSDYARPQEIEGRIVMVETPEEILAKKVFYRAENFTARDVFDFAFLIENGIADFLYQDAMFRNKLDPIAARIENFKDNMAISFERIETVGYNPGFEKAAGIVLDFCRSGLKLSRTSEAKLKSHRPA